MSDAIGMAFAILVSFAIVAAAFAWTIILPTIGLLYVVGFLS